MNKVKRYIKACHICLKTKPKYMKNRPVYGQIPVDYAPMQDLSIDIKTMPPPSNVSSTAEPPSMVRPSVSIVEHPLHYKKKVDFSVSHYV